jgi:CRISPR/Cas system-associated exonuclease Cas4 (RecB family)
MRPYLTISPSSLTTFFKCSQRFKWQFIDELEADEGTDNLYSIFGTTFHKIMQLHHKFNMPYEELIGCWKALFLTYCTDAKRLKLPTDKELETFIKRGYSYIDNGFSMRQRWSGYSFLDAEKYVRIPYPNKFMKIATFLTGRIDLLLGNKEFIVSLDWKTSKSKESNIESNEQMTIYIHFIHLVYNWAYDKIFGCLAYPFDKEIIFTQRDQNQIEIALGKIDILLARLADNDIAKEPKRDMLPDNCMFCPYTLLCEKQ